MERAVVIIENTWNARAPEASTTVRKLLAEHGIAAIGPEALEVTSGVEAAIVLGGDGTLLRAAEQLRGRGIPLLGINLGHMGFLAECDATDMADAVARLARRQYRIDQRETLTGTVLRSGTDPVSGADPASGSGLSEFALNEVALEKQAAGRMVEVAIAIDGRPVSTFGCDGIVVATPTGSTGHAYSAGGPVVWPEVEALLLVPISAHALFTRPFVVAPSSVISIEILARSRSDAQASFDGRRAMKVRAGDVLEVRRAAEPVGLIRFAAAPFADRLVSKFSLPVAGWRPADGD